MSPRVRDSTSTAIFAFRRCIARGFDDDLNRYVLHPDVLYLLSKYSITDADSWDEICGWYGHGEHDAASSRIL